MQIQNFKVIKISVITLLFAALIFSCKKQKTLHNVPYVPVSKSININLPSYSALQGVGGWAFTTGGSKGIIIYRQSISTFLAFDRQPTVTDGLKCDGVVPDSTNYLILNDPCGASQYLLVDGSVYHGPATYGLRAYRTTFDGNYTLTITNY